MIFQVNDYVEVANAQTYTVAQVTGRNGDYILARLAKGGPEYSYRSDQLASSTKEAFEEQSLTRVVAGEWWEQNIRKETKLKETLQKNTYLCLDCGAVYNGSICPTCGSDEHIYNTSRT